jgi:FkbM family methyltransferase
MTIWEGLYLPDGEQHLIDWMRNARKYVDGKPTYQHNKYSEALSLVKKRRRAIDVGGNIGLWSRVMSIDFEVVEAFEPVTEFAEYFRFNAPNAVLHQVALSDSKRMVTMARDVGGSCGDVGPMSSKVKSKAIERVETALLDDFAFRDVDFIKVDCEGYELHVLRGAEQTILGNKPVMIVEQKPGKGSRYGYEDDAAVKYLQGLGMKIHTVLAGDYIMSW